MMQGRHACKALGETVHVHNPQQAAEDAAEALSTREGPSCSRITNCLKLTSTLLHSQHRQQACNVFE